MIKYFIALLLMTSSVFARDYRSFTTSINVKAPTEKKVLQRSQDVIPKIRNLTNKKIRQFALYKKCRFLRNENSDNSKYIKINGIDIDKMYKVEGNFLIPYYRAKLGVTLTKCETRD